MTVTKADIITLLADATGLTKTDVEVLISGFLYNIVESIQNGDRVEIRGFGSFYAKEREPRIIRNPRTKKEIPVDHRFVPVFRPAKFFRESVNQKLLTIQRRETDVETL